MVDRSDQSCKLLWIGQTTQYISLEITSTIPLTFKTFLNLHLTADDSVLSKIPIFVFNILRLVIIYLKSVTRQTLFRTAIVVFVF